MKKRPSLSTSRLAAIYTTAIDYRRGFRADHEFFRMTDVWEDLCGSEQCSIKTYCSDKTEDFKRKACVVALGHSVTLVADERLMVRAEEGCGFMNFMLAHELGHLNLDHHERGVGIKYFQLFSGPGGMSANIPPTVEELEANFAAVFFQCGVFLEDVRWHPVRLAQRAFSDVYYVKKAQSIVQAADFQQELKRQCALKKAKHPLQRVIL